MNRGLMAITAATVVAVILAVAAWVWPGFLDHGGASPVAVTDLTSTAPTAPVAPASTAGPSYPPGGPLPPGALATCQQLVSGTDAQQRSALDPSLAAALPAGTLFPPGTTLTMDGTSWHQDGAYANATGTLLAPGQPDQHVEIGFIQEPSGPWLVTFEGPAP